MKKRLAAGILASVMALSLAECGGGAGSAPAAPAPEEAATAAEGEAAPAEGTAAAPEATATTPGGNPISVASKELGGDTVVFANNEVFSTTDDFNNFTMSNKIFMHTWGDSLVEMDYDTGEYRNALAESIEWSEDYLTAHVKIREGVLFSDGDEVKGEDVAFSYQRVADGEGLANTMSWKQTLAGAEATGDYTADIFFKKPMPNFDCEACALLIISKDAYEADPENFWNAPVGSGPYKWVSTDFVNNTGKLEFWNEDWWGFEAYGKEPGNVKYIVYENIDEDSTRVSSLRTNEIQIAGNLPYADVDTVLGDGLQVLKNDQNDDVFLCINVNNTPALQDVRIRKAMSMAIDRQAIVDAIVGNGVAATFPVPEKSIGYQEGHSYEYDPEGAAALLAEAGYDGTELDIEIASGNIPKGDEVAQAVLSYLQSAGFNAKITQMESAAFSDARFSGNYQIQLCSFSMVNGESWKIMDEIVGRIDFFKMGIDREEAWQYFDQAMVEMDINKRDELMQQGYALVMEDYDPIYLYDRICAIGVASNLEGLVLNTDQTLEMRFMSLK